MGIGKKRLDEILTSFETPSPQSDGESNPADDEFEAPSNFPDTVDVKEINSQFKAFMANPDLGDDYAYLRNVFRHLIDKGLLTLEGAINVAKETENARSIEVVSQLMNTVSDMSEKLMKMHEKTQKSAGASSSGKKGEDEGASSTTNNIYVLEKGKDAKDILDTMLGKALDGECKDVTPEKEQQQKDE